jgi:3-hydroxyacyl-CoA dehydrogenase
MEEGMKGGRLVIEAIPENLEMKRKVWAKIDSLSPKKAILATNSSSIPVSRIESATQRPEKTIIVHGINPPTIIPVVEIVRGEKTSDETAELCYHLLLKLGKRPVRVLREVPGFLFNRLQLALWPRSSLLPGKRGGHGRRHRLGRESWLRVSSGHFGALGDQRLWRSRHIFANLPKPLSAPRCLP